MREWIFSSRRNPDIEYYVTEDSAGRRFCSCPAAEHGIDCWHLQKVEAQLMGERIQKQRYLLKYGKDYFIKKQEEILETWMTFHQHQVRRHF